MSYQLPQTNIIMYWPKFHLNAIFVDMPYKIFYTDETTEIRYVTLTPEAYDVEGRYNRNRFSKYELTLDATEKPISSILPYMPKGFTYVERTPEGIFNGNKTADKDIIGTRIHFPRISKIIWDEKTKYVTLQISTGYTTPERYVDGMTNLSWNNNFEIKGFFPSCCDVAMYGKVASTEFQGPMLQWTPEVNFPGIEDISFYPAYGYDSRIFRLTFILQCNDESAQYLGQTVNVIDLSFNNFAYVKQSGQYTIGTMYVKENNEYKLASNISKS